MVRHEKVLRGERGDRFAREIIIGGEQKPKNGVVANRKTVLLLGRSRAGKTSLINAFANYLFGVKEEDDFRYTVLPMHRRTASINSVSSLTRDGLKLCRTYARTKKLTSYVFNNTILSHPVAFVDTPPIDNDSLSSTWSRDDAFEQIRRWLREGYYCPVEDLEVWLAIPSFDSHICEVVWQTVITVMREIECPVVRLVPVITFARNVKPHQALDSLAEVGYENLIEGENFYTFNSASVLNVDGSILDCDGLSFYENCTHMELILRNLQKQFQWMTLSDGSAVTTVMQVRLNRGDDTRARLYATDSFRAGRRKTGDVVKGTATYAVPGSNLVKPVGAMTHTTKLHSEVERPISAQRFVEEDSAELASVSTDWTRSPTEYAMDKGAGNDANNGFNDVLKGIATHAVPGSNSVKPVSAMTLTSKLLSEVERPISAQRIVEEDSAELASVSTDWTRSPTEYAMDKGAGNGANNDFNDIGVNLIGFKPIHSSPMIFRSVEAETFDGNNFRCDSTSTSETLTELTEVCCNSGNDKALRASTSNVANLYNDRPHYESDTVHAINSAMKISPAVSHQFMDWHTSALPLYEACSNGRSYEQDLYSGGSSTVDGSMDKGFRRMTCNRNRRVERHPTGIEYEIVRFRRRKVKNESTQTSPPTNSYMQTVEKSIFLCSEPDSDDSEYFASDVESQLSRSEALRMRKSQMSTSSSSTLRSEFRESWV